MHPSASATRSHDVHSSAGRHPIWEGGEGGSLQQCPEPSCPGWRARVLGSSPGSASESERAALDKSPVTWVICGGGLDKMTPEVGSCSKMLLLLALCVSLTSSFLSFVSSPNLVPSALTHQDEPRGLPRGSP